MKNNPSGISGFYRSANNCRHTVRIAVRLIDAVDEKALRKAVDIAIKRYDYFSVKFVLKDELLHSVVPNNEPIVITNSSEPVTLLSEESNFHALAVNFFGDTVYFDMIHSITDATGIMEFIKTTLYYYITEEYKTSLPADNIRTAEMPVSDEERRDPYLDIETSEDRQDNAKKPAMPSAVTWDKIMDIDSSRQTVFEIEFSEAEFVDYCKKNGSTPAIMLANMFAKATFGICEKFDAPFRIVLMKNYRAFLKKLLAHNNVTGVIALNYTDEMRGFTPEKLNAICRQMAAYQSTDEYMQSALQRKLYNERKILALGDLDEIRAAFRAASKENLRQVNLTLSYVRMNTLGALEPYIKSVRTYVDPAGSHIIVEANAMNGKFFMNIMQDFSGNTLSKAFINELKAAGIEVSDGTEQTLSCPKMRI